MAVIPAVGDRVAPGGDLVKVLGAKPDLVAMVTSSQRASVRSGQAISIAAPNGATWLGTLGSLERLTDGRDGYAATLGGTLCGNDCGLVPIVGAGRTADRTIGPLHHPSDQTW